MADEKHTITIWPTAVVDATGTAATKWHWKRLNDNGAQVDGSGPQRDGLDTKKAVRELVKAKYADDTITGA